MLESILKTLKTQTSQIHKGQYPKEILQDLGKVGLYANVNNLDDGLYKAIEGVIEVSKICGNTGFCVWCQDILVWYLKHSKLEKTLLEKAIKGDILGGTGLSNPIKSFAKIESIKLKAQKVQGGFILNGILPYVSNIDYGHYFGVIAAIKDESMDSNFVMGLILCEKKRGINIPE